MIAMPVATIPLLSADSEAVNLMPHMPVWPDSWQRLRDQGRLQFRWLAASGQWLGTIPEAGVQVRCRNARALIEELGPHIGRLPRVAEPQRVNGHPWPQAMPASKNLLPRR